MQADLERHLRTEASDGRPRNTTSDRMERIAERRRNATAGDEAPADNTLVGDGVDGNATARTRQVLEILYVTHTSGCPRPIRTQVFKWAACWTAFCAKPRQMSCGWRGHIPCQTVI